MLRVVIPSGGTAVCCPPRGTLDTLGAVPATMRHPCRQITASHHPVTYPVLLWNPFSFYTFRVLKSGRQSESASGRKGLPVYPFLWTMAKPG